MIKKKIFGLIPVCALALAACGGSDSSTGLPSSSGFIADSSALTSPSVNLKKQAHWISFTGESPSAVIMNASAKNTLAETTLIDVEIKKLSNGANIDNADGLYINANELPDNWKELVNTSLDAGQVVVLVDDKKVANTSKMHDISLDAFGFGVNEGALMAYKDENGNLGIMVYTDEQISELGVLMKMVGRRVQPVVNK